jgi:DNA-binding PadR family transcriptional regulator
MSSDELTLFSYEILGLIGRLGAGPHDLRQMVRRGRMLDWAGESRYYVEPKRLATLGYLEARKEPGKTRERTVYTLTDKGMRALREWAQTPARFTPIKSEPLTRLLIADLVGEEATRESLAALREDIADLSARLEEAEASAERLPHRRTYLLITIDFLRRLLELHVELVERVERELAGEPDRAAARG